MARSWLLHIAPLLVPVTILVLGALFRCENCSPSSLGQGVRHAWAGYTIDALLLVQLAATVLLIRAAKGARFVASALPAVNLWCTVWASFLAGMSISGDWL